MEEQKPKGSGMEKIATFIVDKRNLFFLLYVLVISLALSGRKLKKMMLSLGLT